MGHVINWEDGKREGAVRIRALIPSSVPPSPAGPQFPQQPRQYQSLIPTLLGDGEGRRIAPQG